MAHQAGPAAAEPSILVGGAATALLGVLRPFVLLTLALALMKGWEDVLFVGSTLGFANPGALSRHQVYFLAKGTAILLCVLADGRLPRGLIRTAGTCPVCCGLGAAAMVAAGVLLCGGQGTGPGAVTVGASVLGGAGSGIFTLLWVGQCSFMPPVTVVLAYLVQYALTAVVALLCYGPLRGALTPTVALCAVLAFGALAGAYRLARASGLLPDEEAARASDEQPPHAPSGLWQAAALMELMAFVFALWEPMLSGTVFSSGSHTALSSVLVAMALVLYILLRGDERDVLPAFRMVLPCVAVLFLLMPRTLGWTRAVSDEMSDAYVTLTVALVLYVLAGACYRWGRSPIRLLGVAWGVRYLCVFLGETTWHVMDSLLSGVSMDAALGVAAALATAALVVLLPDRRTLYRRWGVGVGMGDRREEGPSAQMRLHGFALEYGLTPREEGVLALLVADRTAAQIQEDLCISRETVKTHRRNIYAKCGVHSHDELCRQARAWGR